MTLFNLNYPLKALSPSIVTLGARASMYKFWGYIVQSVTIPYKLKNRVNTGRFIHLVHMCVSAEALWVSHWPLYWFGMGYFVYWGYWIKINLWKMGADLVVLVHEQLDLWYWFILQRTHVIEWSSSGRLMCHMIRILNTRFLPGNLDFA